MNTFIRCLGASLSLVLASPITAQVPLTIYPIKDTYRSQSQRIESPTLVAGENGGFTALLTFQLPDLPATAIDSAFFYFAPVMEDEVSRINRPDIVQFFTCSKDNWQAETLTTINFPLFEKWLTNYPLSPNNGYGISHFINVSEYVQQEAAGDKQVSILFTKLNRENTRFAASEWHVARQRPYLLVFTDVTTPTVDLQQVEPSFAVMPNPIHDLFTLQLNDFQQNVIYPFQILNTMGAVVLQGQLSQRETQFELAHLPASIYLLQVQFGETVITQKIVKN